MTCRPDPEDFAAGRLRAGSVEEKIASRHRTPGAQCRSAAPAGSLATYLAAMFRSAAAGVRWCARRYLRALDVSRRWHAAVEQAKHRDLIYDPATGIAFATRPREHGDACAMAQPRGGQTNG